jgi:metal-dependent amidase/aminoacylase/carboxypeptidase family protein
MPPMMASEDFGYFSLDHKISTAIFWLGASDPAKVAQSRASGVPLPDSTQRSLRLYPSQRYGPELKRRRPQ